MRNVHGRNKKISNVESHVDVTLPDRIRSLRSFKTNITVLHGELLEYKKQFKFLGITFDGHLSYDKHIQLMINKCKKRLNLLKALRGKDWGASPQTIIYTYKAYIRPIMEYGCILFAYAKENLLKQIQAIETD